MKLVKHGLLAVPLLLCFDCKKSDLSDPDFRLDGTYFYTASDGAGKVLISGTIQLVIRNEKLSGTWTLSLVGSADPAKTGPQVGKGILKGSADQEVVSINLNPGVCDNNVFLAGGLTGTTLCGDWTYSGFAGSIGGGKFTAIKTE